MRTVAIAGNYAIFRAAQQDGRVPKDATYISQPEQLMGIDNFRLVRLHGWSERRDRAKLQEIISTRRGVVEA